MYRLHWLNCIILWQYIKIRWSYIGTQKACLNNIQTT